MNNFTQNVFTSSKNSFKKFVAVCVFLLVSGLSFGQVTIASEGFNNTSTLFTVSGGAYYTGNSATGDRPASSPLAVEGTHSYGLNATSTATTTATMTTSDINTSAYTGVSTTFRLAAFSISSTGNGMDGTDIVAVSISPDGGTNYYSTVRVLGNSNAYWSYSAGTGIASTAYDGNATSADFAPTTGGNRTTDGYSTVTITNLPAVTNLRIRITLTNNATAERWVVDDFKVSGTLATVAPTVSTTTVSSITISSATSGGNVTADGGATVSARGVAFGTSANPTTGTSDGTGTGTFTSSLTGLSPNTQYFYRAYATNSVNTSYGSEFSFYTLANVPGVVTVGNPQISTLGVTVNATTENSNPSATVYALHETSTNQFVQADGTLGATAVWQTAAAWSTITVTGLTQNTTYTFEAKARNQASVETSYGATASGTTLANLTPGWCNLQWPFSHTMTEGNTVDVFARVNASGITDSPGQGANLQAWVGYSTTNGTPDNTWTWVSASYFGDDGLNNDEYKAILGAGMAPGTYYYASRFQIGSGSYVYGGTNNGFWGSTANSGVLTINADVVDYCNVAPSGTNNVDEGTVFTLYSDVYEPGITPGAGQGAGITAYIGYSSTSNNPTIGAWTWVAAIFHAQSGNNDVYKIDLPSNLPIGTYNFASRYVKTGSSVFTYGGTNGIWNNDSGVLNVVSNLVDYCNVQYPLSGTITQGDAFNVFAQVYEPGVTPGAGQGAGITSWIGYSSSNVNPNDPSWSWVATTYNGTVTGNNDEYTANIATSLTPGTYYYASRFQKTGSTQFQYGGTNGVWNGDNATLVVNQAVPVVTGGSPSGTVGAAFNYTISATNSPTSYAVVSGTLPAGLSLNTTTGLISGTPTTAGSASVDVTATNSSATSTAATLNFTIAQGSQTITFGALTPVTYGVSPYALSATASSGLTVTYASSNTAVATISGNTITVVGAGTTTITASQVGDSNYLAATDVNQLLTVNQKALTITGVTANNKVQDGTTTATLSGAPSLNGVELVDVGNVTVSGTPTANFASALPGTGIAVIVTGYTLTGTASGNYTVSQPTGLTADITGLNAPVAIEETGVLDTSFNANWNAVSGATSYELDVLYDSQILQTGVTIFNNSGTVGAAGWTETSVIQGNAFSNDYYQLLSFPSTLISPAVDFDVISSESLVFKARTFGGPSTAQATITVSISTNNGSTWTTIGTRIPGSTTLINMAPFDLSAYNGTQVKIRFQTLGAGSSKGVGIDDIVLTANQMVDTIVPVLGYNALNVGNVTSYNVTGLTSCTKYYYRVRAVNGSVVSANSNTITVDPISIGGSVVGNQTVCYNAQPTTLTLSGHCGAVVKWQKSSDTLFTSPIDIASTSLTIGGVVIGTLTSTTYFRAVVQSAANPIAYSAYVTVTVQPIATITTQPQPQTVCEGSVAAFTVALTGSTTYSYEWKKDGVAISGAPDLATYTIASTTLAAAGSYSVDVLDDCLNIISSSTAVLTINAQTVPTFTQVAPICVGATLSALPTTSDNGVPGTWSPALDNTQTTVYTFTPTVGQCATTVTMTIEVNPLPTLDTITATPACINSPSTVTMTGLLPSTAGSFTYTNSMTGPAVYNVSGVSDASGNFTFDTPNLPAVANGAIITITSGTATATGCTTNFTGKTVTVVVGKVTTWTGTIWDQGTPTSIDTAVIPLAYSEVANIDACSLVVNTNAVVTIPSGSNVTLHGALTVDTGSSFTLNSNANLVQTTDVANSGNITVRRTTNPLMRFDYVLWSSPVDGTQSLLNFSPLTSVSPTVRFYTYNSSNDQYVSVASTSAEFLNATGYLIRLPFNHPTAPVAWTGSFVGQPNNGPISLSTTSGLYYATGNPYPSTIDADAFIADNNLNDALYFWRKTNGAAGSAYATYTLAGGTTPTPGTGASPTSAVPNGTIQVGQGFLAKATSTSLVFNNQMRIADNANQTFRTSSNALSTNTIERNRIWLNLSNATATIGQTMVSYMTGATNGIDAQIDGKYINDSQTALTSIVDGQEFAIQGKMLPFETTDVVPLGFKSEVAGNFSISLYDKDGLFLTNSQVVYLRDNLTTTVHDLTSGVYNFTSESGTFNNRFEIIYQNALNVNNPTLTANDVIVYNSNNELTINTGNFEMATVKVFDVRGRLLVEKSKINASQTSLNVGETNQIVLVQIISNEGIIVTKKVIN